MAEFTIYHNGRCSKSRGALEILQERGLDHEVRYYLSEPLSEDELRGLLMKLRMPAASLVRKTEALYQEQYKDRELSEDGWIEALAAHPGLIERPIVVRGAHAVVARPPERVLELL